MTNAVVTQCHVVHPRYVHCSAHHTMSLHLYLLSSKMTMWLLPHHRYQAHLLRASSVLAVIWRGERAHDPHHPCRLNCENEPRNCHEYSQAAVMVVVVVVVVIAKNPIAHVAMKHYVLFVKTRCSPLAIWNHPWRTRRVENHLLLLPMVHMKARFVTALQQATLSIQALSDPLNTNAAVLVSSNPIITNTYPLIKMTVSYHKRYYLYTSFPF